MTGLDWASLDDTTRVLLTLSPLALVGLAILFQRDESLDWNALRAYHRKQQAQRRRKRLQELDNDGR